MRNKAVVLACVLIALVMAACSEPSEPSIDSIVETKAAKQLSVDATLEKKA